jgi:LuxR family quorum sensing-dependent transcriptional regulator
MSASPAGLALSFVEAIGGLDTPESVMAAFSKAASEFGFSTVALGELPRPSSDEIPEFFVSTWPRSWFDAYVGESLVASDPTLDIARFGNMPVSWSEARQHFGPKNPKGRVFEICGEFGWPEGLVIPVHGPGGYSGVVSLAGDTAELAPAARAMLHLMALYLHERLRELVVPKAVLSAEELPHLTEKEVACVEWLIAGKSDWEIGEIINVAESTVHYRIERAKKKLGVKTRAQLTALAVLHGYVRP